jgi:glycosyltransferase involved in cell wall biosynthesis
LPPPTNGFSVVSAAMLSSFGRCTRVIVLNQAPVGRGSASWLFDLFRVVRQAVQCAGALLQRPRPYVYLALSGGGRQSIDFVFVALTAVFGSRIVFHHHSFGYLTRPRRLTGSLLRLNPKAEHIALCGCMKERLATTYDIEPTRVRVLSNAAFVGLGEDIAVAALGDREIRLGFLSNITSDKGIFGFFDLLDASRQGGIPVSGSIAGPIDPGIAEDFHRRLECCPNGRYLGALYGEEKRAFFRSLDILVFPSRYANEAEPVTILEAASAGALVFGTDRGCIPDMLEELGGMIANEEVFCDRALDELRRLNMDRTALVQGRRAAQTGFLRLKTKADAELEEIVSLAVGA